jgi:hypothetical protein
MDRGDEREMESGLIFNQLICEFESRRPCQTCGRMLSVTTSSKCKVTIRFPCRPQLTWVVAQLAEHRTVTAAIEGSTPFDPPKDIADWRLPIADWRS